MTGSRKAPGKSRENVSSLEQGLDRSRKHKLWLSSNTIGLLAISGFIALSISRIVNDIRGEYTGRVGRLGVVRLSIEHRDGQIFADLTIPHTHPMHCVTAEKNVGENVDWSFTDAYRPAGASVVSFHGQAESGSITGVLQDNLNVLNCFPIKLQRDDLASVFRQIRTAIPGSQESYEPKEPTTFNKSTR
ncbi:MAG: hypothetical protein P4L53_16560 [Candidatus Obscuribacterales bacterium]|nr:hypothetical protein [Candidatus Obscuribacterales bacterium]